MNKRRRRGKMSKKERADIGIYIQRRVDDKASADATLADLEQRRKSFAPRRSPDAAHRPAWNREAKR